MNGEQPQQDQFVSYETPGVTADSGDGMKKAVIIGSIVLVVVGLIIVGIVVLRARVLNSDDAITSAQQEATAENGTIRSAPPPVSEQPGVTNPTTTLRHTRPNTPAVSEDSPDSDGDGLSDAEEGVLGLDSQKTDTDGDGYDDFDELRKYGTDPLDPDNNPDTTEGRYQPDKPEN